METPTTQLPKAPEVEKQMATAVDFEAIRLRLASPDQIHKWSHGEVTKPETINYRTQKPEKDGLFSEEIFGPTKDWECYCGKYKRIRYKGIVCDKCGVEVTRSIVRRERMGHIDLAVPVSHIWFLRGVPSKIGTVLDLSVQQLEKVVYFASYIIMEVNTEARDAAFKQIEVEYKNKKREIDAYFLDASNVIKKEGLEKIAAASDDKAKKSAEKSMDEALAVKNEEKQLQYEKLEKAVEIAKKELRELQPLRIISEVEYRDLSMKYGHIFKAGIGAEALKAVVEKIDLAVTVKQLEGEAKTAVASKKKKVIRRLKILKAMHKAKIRPEWMFLTALPVLPPDLRPMVPLDGGRYAASDLNDLYRRVINRNNRLKRLIEINSPEVITRNEKRMLQEAVDALIDNNARRGKAVAATTGQKRTLKSLADMLKGKQGRFRQNLLGKRVDYSGRSVIVVGSKLRLHQCGLPKRMALELYKPFIINKLIEKEFAYNVRSASKLIEQERPEVWDMLEEAIQGTHVLLNRAPTLHRLGIQAFEPHLIEGKAIQLHPMVCTAFNADFDGDQMAVHLPLTTQARQEAREIMLSSHNLLKPATGEPIVSPTQDIVLGCYYMTGLVPGRKGEGKVFGYSRECILAYEFGLIDINAAIKVRLREGELVETSAGRILFNLVLPKEMWFRNEQMDKKKLKKIINETLERFGRDRAAQLIDDVKDIGYEYLTTSGMSWGMADLQTPEGKAAVIEKADAEVELIYDQYKNGLLTDEERYDKVIEIWARVKAEVTEQVRATLPKFGTVYSMIESGARGSWGQVTQMMGMKGLVASPSGRTIELPVKGNFKEGFDVLEYFISTHGTRKGMADTALRTANAGYLTRRLVDVSQDVVIEIEDCGDDKGIELTADETETFNVPLAKRIIGRYTVEPVVDAKTGEVLVEKDQLVEKKLASILDKATLEKVRIRSLLSCVADRGACQKCYGYDLGNNELVQLGSAVGIVAAQAIGEPGTQLTMQTFHTGGVASSDITQGLPRVEELFEARQIKKPAPIAHIDGKIRFEEKGRQKSIWVVSQKLLEDTYEVDSELERIKVKDGEKVEAGQILAIRKDKEKIKAENSGTVKLAKNKITVAHDTPLEKEYVVPAGAAVLVQPNQEVLRGHKLTEGSLDLRELFEVSGRDALQKYILQEVQQIYLGQGQDVNDKHIEIIIRAMLSRVKINDPGDTEFLPDEVVTRSALKQQNARVEEQNGKPATHEELLLGITKASLSTDSFLSAASFQETAKVLIDAAISSKVDYLNGLKENVIIGKLIPSGHGYAERRKRVMKVEDLETIAESSVQTSERIGVKKR